MPKLENVLFIRALLNLLLQSFWLVKINGLVISAPDYTRKWRLSQIHQLPVPPNQRQFIAMHPNNYWYSAHLLCLQYISKGKFHRLSLENKYYIGNYINLWIYFKSSLLIIKAYFCLREMKFLHFHINYNFYDEKIAPYLGQTKLL